MLHEQLSETGQFPNARDIVYIQDHLFVTDNNGLAFLYDIIKYQVKHLDSGIFNGKVVKVCVIYENNDEFLCIVTKQGFKLWMLPRPKKKKGTIRYLT